MPPQRAPLGIAQAVGSRLWWDNSRIWIPGAAGYLARQAEAQTSGQEHAAKIPFYVGYCRFKMRCRFHIFIPCSVLLQFVLPFTEVLSEIRSEVTRKVGFALLKS